MAMMRCCVCLELKDSPESVSTCVDGNATWHCMLQTIVPEVDWREEYLICSACGAQLSQVYTFRRLCLKLDRERLEQLQPEDFPGPPSPVIKVEECTIKAEPVELEDPFIADTVLPTTKPICQMHYLIVQQSGDKVKPERKVFGKMYLCDRCDKPFSSKSYMRTHRKWSCKSVKFFCKLCGSTFATIEELNNHSGTFHRNYKCPKCVETFISSKEMREHKFAVHNNSGTNCERQFPCPLCEVKFETGKEYRLHLCQHCSFQMACCVCGKEYTEEHKLFRHLEMVHNTHGAKYECSTCDLQFAYKYLLASHNRSEHSSRAIGNTSFEDVKFE